MSRMYRVVFVTSLAALVGCGGARKKLEKMVPDGADVMVSVDAKGVRKSDLYKDLKSSVPQLAEAYEEAESELCDLELEKVDVLVFAADFDDEKAMAAVRGPDFGAKDTISCLADTIDDDDAVVWAADDDTLVIATESWAEDVKARIDGKGKPAVDGSLEEAVDMARRGDHLWMAYVVPAELDALVSRSEFGAPKYGAVSAEFDEGVEIRASAKMASESDADKAVALVLMGKSMAKSFGKEEEVDLSAILDSLEVEADDDVVELRMEIGTEPIEIARKSMEKYVSRSKTSEAKVQLAKMFDATSAYFQEEHVSRGNLAEVVPHRCPNDGRAAGSTPITPPLSVNCNRGPGGRCVPSASGDAKDGYYPFTMWSDDDVWNGLNFQMEQAHYFHYRFIWSNGTSGYGDCMFTAQAFADLDDDGVYSTYERSGAADVNGVNAAAGLYIDYELE